MLLQGWAEFQQAKLWKYVDQQCIHVRVKDVAQTFTVPTELSFQNQSDLNPINTQFLHMFC